MSSIKYTEQWWRNALVDDLPEFQLVHRGIQCRNKVEHELTWWIHYTRVSLEKKEKLEKDWHQDKSDAAVYWAGISLFWQEVGGMSFVYCVPKHVHHEQRCNRNVVPTIQRSLRHWSDHEVPTVEQKRWVSKLGCMFDEGSLGFAHHLCLKQQVTLF